MSHPEKQQLINLIYQLIQRSGLSIEYVVARMQATGCDITRNSFENHFTTRANRRPNVPPDYVISLIAALTNGLAQRERCTAAEAIELARLTRLPIDQFRAINPYFSTAEFITAYRNYAPLPSHAVTPPANEDVADLPCPYRGLHPFDEDHADYFFGREADIEWLLTTLQRSRFLAVIGPSGSGKSSLVRAGLIPALRRGDEKQASKDSKTFEVFQITVFEPSPQPLTALATALLGNANRNPSPWIETMLADELGLHRLVSELLADHPAQAEMALVVDQFEELFTLCQNEPERRALIANLLRAATLPESRTIVILTMRSDFYSQAATYPDLALYLADRQVLLSPLTDAELRQVITRPAQKVGLQFEAGLVDRLLQDTAAAPGALPLLQHTLLELWERRQGRQLTLAAYQSIGGVQGALARRADTLLSEFAPPQQAIVRRVMLRLTQLGDNTADTRRRATLTELIRSPDEAADVRRVVTRLADARLVTTSRNRENGAEMVDVAHEALIRGWPTLQGWLMADQEALRLHRQLTEVALEWGRNKRDESYLFRGVRLAAAEEWAETQANEMNILEREFLAASVSARDRRAIAREKQRQRTVRNLTLALAGTLLTLAIVIGLTVFAFNRQQQVEAQRRETLSRQLAAQALDLMEDQYDLALLLSAEAYQIADTVEARSVLLETLQTSPYLSRFLRGHSDWVWSVAFSPDGQTLASGSADGTIRLWDVEKQEPRGLPLTGHSGWVRSVTFSPDGQLLASGGDDRAIILWDVKRGEPVAEPLIGHASFVTDLAFSPDGQMLASSSADGTVRLWDVATGQPIGSPLLGHSSFVLSVAFSPNGQLLASGGADQSVILWDIHHYGANSEQPLARALTGHQGEVFSLAFNPDTPQGSGGQTLASGSADGAIILWDVETQQPRREPLVGHEAGVNSVAFSPDGQTLISGSDDQTVRMWHAASGQPLGRPLIGHADEVLGVAFSPATVPNAEHQADLPAGIIASAGADGMVILWDVSSVLNPNVPLPQTLGRYLTGHTDSVRGVAISPDGQILASGSADTTIMLWDMATGQLLGAPLTQHTSFVNDVDFSPDGRLLASASDDRMVILWDVATRQPIGPPLAQHGELPVLHVHFGPVSPEESDNQQLVSTDEGSNVFLWRIEPQVPPELTVLPGRSKGVAFSPDGQRLVMGWGDSGKDIILWDMNLQEPIEPVFKGHQGTIQAVAYHPDGKKFTSSSFSENEIIMWDVDTHQPIQQPLTGHTDFIRRLDFSPDGRILASGGDDGTIILWDAATWQRIALPLNNGGQITDFAFSSNGRILASGGRNDGKILLWDVDSESWLEKACHSVTRNMSPAEWDRHLTNEPYHLTCPQAPEPNQQIKPRTNLSTPIVSETVNLAQTLPAAIVEEFDSDQGFIQTSENVAIADGQVQWHFKRNAGKQYVYRHIPAFRGNARLIAKGQVDSWTNNCAIQVGIGEELGQGVTINFGWFGGGCPTNGPLISADGVALDYNEPVACEYIGNWLWVEDGKPYTAELMIDDGNGTLSVEGVGQANGTVNYDGLYTTLWVGHNGRGDWPECSGIVESVIIEPLE